MQLPILSGIYADVSSDFRTSYPLNMMPVPKQTGISAGYLRPLDGAVASGVAGGTDRGGINWDGLLYRVMGSDLVSITKAGVVTVIGDVGSGGRVSLSYGFDYLAIASGGNLFMYDKTDLTQVTDPDLGVCLDVVWIDGYFMSTDGEFLVVTELGDPFSVNPLKYGSSEIDPDPVLALVKLRNEIYALNRYSIEVFDNVGGTSTEFPFVRIDGAQIERGTVGTHACCVFMDSLAFIGGGLNEAPAIYIGGNGTATKISTREIEEALQEYTEAELSKAVLEVKVDKAHNHLIVQLQRHTFIFDGAASQVMQAPIWFQASTSIDGVGPWRAQSFVWAYNQWNVADSRSSTFGYLVDDVSTHWGEDVRWQFGTIIVYNAGQGAIVHDLELIGLTGSAAFGETPTIATQYSVDGVMWSNPKTIRAGKFGQRNKRLVWLQQGHMKNMRMQRFYGTSEAHTVIAALEARIEGLAL